MSTNDKQRMSTMPEDFQVATAGMNLRTKSGNLDLEKTAKTFVDQVDENKSLKKIIIGMSIAAALLIGSIFGVSIAAARLAKDTYVDPYSGVMMAKHGSMEGTPIKTVEPLYQKSNVAVEELSNEELFSLKRIVLGNSDTPVVFDVKGFSRGPNATVLLVEGGTLSYYVDGGMDATGSALTLLMTVFEEENFVVEDGGNGRKLMFTATEQYRRNMQFLMSYCGGEPGSPGSRCGRPMSGAPSNCVGYPDSPTYTNKYYNGADVAFWDQNLVPGTTFEEKLAACIAKCDANDWIDPIRYTGKCVGIGYAVNADYAGMSFCYGVMDSECRRKLPGICSQGTAELTESPNWMLLMKNCEW